MRTLDNGTFYGHATGSLQLGGVTLTETRYAPGFVVPLHDHAHPIFCLGLAGQFTEHAGRRCESLGARSVFFQPAGEGHAETFHDAPARLFNVQLGADWLAWADLHAIRLPAVPVNVTRGRLSILALQLHAEYRLREGPLRLAVDGLLLSMLAELTRGASRRVASRRPGWLDGVVDALHDRFREGIGLGDLAALANVDPSHLAAVFRRHMGCTTGDYVRALRLEHARRALSGSDAPLSEVAAAAGYADQSHMTRAFRAALGTTPADYRRRTR